MNDKFNNKNQKNSEPQPISGVNPGMSSSSEKAHLSEWEGFDNLLAHIRTTKEKEDCLSEIEDAQDVLFVTSDNVDEEIAKDLTDFLYKSFSEYKKENQADFSKYKDEVTRFFETLPEIRIEFAKALPESTLEKISQWLRLNVNEKILIDLAINPENVGGIVVVYEGRYLDATIKTYIDSFFSDPTKIMNKYVS
jgi:F0F1-type ATP synthase delta subunit